MHLGFTLLLPHDEASVALVRHLCRDALEELGVIPETVGDIEVAVTEACGNVLRHAQGAERDYEVSVAIGEDSCEIRVVDTGPGFDHDNYGPDAPVDMESGRGVFLMRALVDDLKFVSRSDTGTSVSLVKRLVSPESSLLHRLCALPIAEPSSL